MQTLLELRLHPTHLDTFQPGCWPRTSALWRRPQRQCPSPTSLTPDLLSGHDHGVRIAASPGKGIGAFAVKAFNIRDTVGDYTGEMLTLAQHDSRYGDADMTPADEVAAVKRSAASARQRLRGARARRPVH